jgi:hypothetical protein
VIAVRRVDDGGVLMFSVKTRVNCEKLAVSAKLCRANDTKQRAAQLIFDARVLFIRLVTHSHASIPCICIKAKQSKAKQRKAKTMTKYSGTKTFPKRSGSKRKRGSFEVTNDGYTEDPAWPINAWSDTVNRTTFGKNVDKNWVTGTHTPSATNKRFIQAR